MLRRLLMVLVLLGAVQGGADALAEEEESEDRVRPMSPTSSVELACMQSADLLAEASKPRPDHRWRAQPCLVERDEALWLARDGGQAQSIEAGLISPLDEHTAGVALTHGQPGANPELLEDLFRAVLATCREQGYLKVVVQWDGPLPELRRAAERHGLLFSRQRDGGEDGPMVEFYTNLYFRSATGPKASSG